MNIESIEKLMSEKHFENLKLIKNNIIIEKTVAYRTLKNMEQNASMAFLRFIEIFAYIFFIEKKGNRSDFNYAFTTTISRCGSERLKLINEKQIQKDYSNYKPGSKNNFTTNLIKAAETLLVKNYTFKAEFIYDSIKMHISEKIFQNSDNAEYLPDINLTPVGKLFLANVVLNFFMGDLQKNHKSEIVVSFTSGRTVQRLLNFIVINDFFQDYFLNNFLKKKYKIVEIYDSQSEESLKSSSWAIYNNTEFFLNYLREVRPLEQREDDKLFINWDKFSKSEKEHLDYLFFSIGSTLTATKTHDLVNQIIIDESRDSSDKDWCFTVNGVAYYKFEEERVKNDNYYLRIREPKSINIENVVSGKKILLCNSHLKKEALIELLKYDIYWKKIKSNKCFSTHCFIDQDIYDSIVYDTLIETMVKNSKPH